jgi:trigger factor
LLGIFLILQHLFGVILQKGIRYDLIESRIVQDHGLEVSHEELENHAMGYLQKQMAQSGYAAMGMNEDFLKNYAKQMLENQENAQQFNREILSKKILELFKEKSNLKKKQVSYDNFIKEVYASKK